MATKERLTLSEMRGRSTSHFFDRATMKFFDSFGGKKTKYLTRYDRETGINYILVIDPWGKRHYHKFHPNTGNITPVLAADVPLRVREK